VPTHDHDDTVDDGWIVFAVLLWIAVLGVLAYMCYAM
jgi:hypothetical protein